MRTGVVIAIAVVVAGGCSPVAYRTGAPPARSGQRASVVSEGKKLPDASPRGDEATSALVGPLSIDVDPERPVLGNEDGEIVIIEFSDFQCPFCQRGFRVMEELLAVFGARIRYQYRHLPLDLHPLAMPAALRYEAISLHSHEKATRFRQLLYQNQERLMEEGYLDQVTAELGLDVNLIRALAERQETTMRVERDIAEAKELGFTGTPGFVVAGFLVKGAYPLEHFEEIICRVLNGEDTCLAR